MGQYESKRLVNRIPLTGKERRPVSSKSQLWFPKTSFAQQTTAFERFYRQPRPQRPTDSSRLESKKLIGNSRLLVDARRFADRKTHSCRLIHTAAANNRSELGRAPNVFVVKAPDQRDGDYSSPFRRLYCLWSWGVLVERRVSAAIVIVGQERS